MFEFDIVLRPVPQVQRFDVHVGNAWQNINGKDFMGMFSLDYSQPVRVSIQCTQEEYGRFFAEAEPFRV